jgi:hypothetical protein
VRQCNAAGSLDLPNQHSGDEESGDNEEDVDPNEAARYEWETCVIQQHEPDSDGAQAFDIGAETPHSAV